LKPTSKASKAGDARENSRQRTCGISKKRFDIGLATQKDVIDFQSQFLEAQGGRVVCDYELQQCDLGLETCGKDIIGNSNGPEKESDPWWVPC